MIYGKLLSILLQGFAIGSGPCMIICAPILLPYIAGTKRTWQEGLKATLIFGLTRMLIYTLMGGVVGYIGYSMFNLFYNRAWGMYVWVIGGLFIITLGILIMLGKGIKNPVCKFLQTQTLENSNKSMVFLGIVIGFSPCLPLIAVLTEIMFMVEEFYQGFLYGAAFGVGTVLSPLLLLGALAPVFPSKFIKTEKAGKVFNAVCGFLLIAVGIYIIWQKLF